MLNRLSQLGLVLCLAAGVAAAQKDVPPPTPKPAPISKPEPSVKVNVPVPPRAPRYPRYDGVTTEKDIGADTKLTVQLCVFEGDVKINGTPRDQGRGIGWNGARFQIRTFEKKAENRKGK